MIDKNKNKRLLARHYANDIELAYDWKNGEVDDDTFFDRLHFLNVSDCNSVDLLAAMKEAVSLIEDQQEEILSLTLKLEMMKAEKHDLELMDEDGFESFEQPTYNP